jgi:hypothetical protein
MGKGKQKKQKHQKTKGVEGEATINLVKLAVFTNHMYQGLPQRGVISAE